MLLLNKLLKYGLGVRYCPDEKKSLGTFFSLVAVFFLFVLVLANHIKRVANPLNESFGQKLRTGEDSFFVSDGDWLRFIENFEPFNIMYKEFLS